MGLFFYTKIGSIIFIGDLPTTNIIEPRFLLLFYFGSLSTVEWVEEKLRFRKDTFCPFFFDVHSNKNPFFEFKLEFL